MRRRKKTWNMSFGVILCPTSTWAIFGVDEKLLAPQTFALADLMALPKARSQTTCIKAIVKVHLFRMCNVGNVNGKTRGWNKRLLWKLMERWCENQDASKCYVRNTIGACLLKGQLKSRSMAIFITMIVFLKEEKSVNVTINKNL